MTPRDAEDYMALPIPAARKAIDAETRVDVLRDLAAKEPRPGVARRADARLQALRAAPSLFAPPEAPAPEPEPAPEAPEAPVPEALVPPAAEQVERTTTRYDVLVARGVERWACRMCGVERPLKEHGVRRAAGHLYMQPRCSRCRNLPRG